MLPAHLQLLCPDLVVDDHNIVIVEGQTPEHQTVESHPQGPNIRSLQPQVTC